MEKNKKSQNGKSYKAEKNCKLAGSDKRTFGYRPRGPKYPDGEAPDHGSSVQK